MSEHTHLDPQPDVEQEQLVSEPESNESTVAVDPASDESTIGTGTSMALGCIAGTILLIVFGLLFLLISRFI